jgi:putative sigma-54 modulation protein
LVEVRLHSRNTTIGDGLHAAVAEKVSHAGRVFDHDTLVDVEVSEASNPRRADQRFRIELTSNVGGRFIRVASDASSPEAALDDAVDRFTRQLRRLKERVIDGRRKGGAGFESPVPTDDDDIAVVRTKRFVMKPMTVDEAGLQMDLLGHEFFFFLSASTDKHTVLYRRRDGGLGMIEPA